jgi:subtilisin family serine protease
MPAVDSKVARTLFSIIALALFAAACQSDPTAPRSDEPAIREQAEVPAPVQPTPAPALGMTPAGTSQTGVSGIAYLGVSPEARSEVEALRAGGSGSLRDQYIVVFRDGAPDVAGLAQQLAAAHGGTLRHTYTSTLKGFAARMSAQSAAALARDARVLFVEADQVGKPAVTQNLPTGQPWGLDRIDQRFGLSKSYIYGHTGAGIYAYILDTGLDSDHPDFGGRARNVATAFNDNGEDCHGHGTHVAGTVGGTKHGVAKKVLLQGVKISGCDGWALTSDAIAAVEWVRINHRKPAVANMSFGFPKSAALNNAVNKLAASGVFISVSAGNENANACNSQYSSPASATGAFTTAATGSSLSPDAKYSLSNWGPCVDGYAPGYAILSARVGGGGMSKSGTSMAAPHVAGVAALLKQAYGNKSSSWITTSIKNSATPSVVEGNPAGTPNRLLFKDTL